MGIIFESHGIELVRSGEKYFLRYDAGELVSKINEIEISEKEAIEIQAIAAEQGLYDYMIHNLNDRLYS